MNQQELKKMASNYADKLWKKEELEWNHSEADFRVGFRAALEYILNEIGTEPYVYVPTLKTICIITDKF